MLGGFDAFVSGGRVWRSSAAHDYAARLASGLQALGVAPGDPVLLWLPNSAELAFAWRAVLRTGGVAIVAHRSAPLQQIRQLVAETQPTTIMTFAGLDHQSLGETVRHRIHVDSSKSPGSIALSQLVAEHGALREPTPRADDDIAFIQYTSGSTGTPKGVITRHGALVATLKNLQAKRFARWRRPVRQLSVLPMSSSFGSLPLFEGLGRKCTHFVLDRFDPEEVLQVVQAHRIEKIFLVPAMCEAILAVRNFRRFDLSSLQAVVCGGAIVTPALVERFQAATGIHIDVRYGMTGVGGVSWASPDSKSGSVGRPFAHLQAKVVDSEGHALPVGEIGELVLYLRKGAAIEYWNPAASASVASDPEGWHRTGDLARLDADGELFVIGRSDDLIIQGGHNVYAETVAEIIRRLPAVRECAVVGVPSDFLGQEVVACVALQQDAELAAGEIIAHCRTQLEALAAPTAVWFIEALPRNESGKVKNFELRDAIQDARGDTHDTGLFHQLAASAATDRHIVLRREVERMLGNVLSESGAHHASTGTSFQEIGLDSLGAMELTHLLSEAIGRLVPATLTYSHPTIDAACDFLLELMGWHPSRRVVGSADPSPMPVRPEAEDVRLDAFLSRSELDTAARSTQPRDSTRVVFLTGANGFLGRFIALDLLNRLPADGRLYALVRATDNVAALERLREAYRADPIVLNFLDQQLQRGRLIVYAGDVSHRHFGFAQEQYDRLCAEVDCIVHNAAVVDHLLGYHELFAPNVQGTVEVIRFALARQRKAINYVSTIAAQWEDGKSVAQGKGQPAAGYVATKLASQRLLRELHQRFGTPIRIYRPSYIMAHSESPGQINAQDTLTRLLQGIVSTSVAPRSFYGEGEAASEGRYGGLPVDSVARSIVALSTAGEIRRAGYVEYNIVNPHHDGGLDAIVNWVQSAGYRVERIDDYGMWYRMFKDRLNSLSRLQRQQSLLPLLHAWEQPRWPGGPEYDTASYWRDVAIASRNAGADSPVAAPRITEAFIHKCLHDMQVLGLIDRSPR